MTTKELLIISGIVVFVIIVSLGFSNMISANNSFSVYCAEKFAGIVYSGYCIYNVNGNSVSFPMDVNWIRENTDFFGQLKEKPAK